MSQVAEAEGPSPRLGARSAAVAPATAWAPAQAPACAPARTPVTLLVEKHSSQALVGRLLAACAQAGRPAACAAGGVAAGGIVIDLSGVRESPGQEIWRLRAGGRPLVGRFALSASWQRPPHAVPVTLTRRRVVGIGMPDETETIGVAHISAGGRLSELREKVAATAALLVERALGGTGLGAQDAVGAAAPGQDGVAALVGGWLRWQAARWHERLFVEWWTVGVSAQPIGTVLQEGGLGPITWLRPKPGRGPGAAYWADPFVWPGTDRMLCEEVALAGGPGAIVALREAADGGWTRERVLLGDQMHRSYPFTFREDGDTYLLPECVGGPTVLYRLGDAGPIETAAEIWPRSLADATLFRHADRYWVAATDVAIGPHDNLCLFHADRLDGPWRPHRANPVRLDIRAARPAGTPFLQDGQLFRPAQDCAAAYGAAIVINRVVSLTPEMFEEHPVLRLAPDPAGPLPHGLHTISAAGGRTLVDGKRMVLAPGRAINRAINRAIRRVARGVRAALRRPERAER